jgi:hypothetical protein
MRKLLTTLLFSIWACAAQANVPCSLPNNLLNGTTADATQVMANYNAIITCLTQAAVAGNNNDITSLTALTTPITPAQGGSTVYVGGTSTGSANAQTVAVLTPNGFALTTGNSVVFKAGFTNNSSMTLLASSTVATNVFVMQPSAGPAALQGGEIQAGQLYQVTYDGTQFILMNPSPTQHSRTLTGGDSVKNGDDQGRIVLGGGVFFALTLPSTGSLTDQQFWVDVINSDVSAGKLMAVTGGTNFYLYPGQVKRFFSNGAGGWSWTPAFERWRKGGAQFYADVANGNDNNDCLSTGAGRACQHICSAITRMYNDLDAQNGQPTINVAATGVYTESCALAGQLTGVNVFNITAAGSLTWKPNGTSPNLFSQDGAEVILNGPFLLDNGGGSNGVVALAVHQTGVLDFNNGLTFANYVNGAYMQCDHGGGSINLPANWSINGGTGTVLQLGGACSSTWTGGGTLTINGGSSCSTFISMAGSGANLAMAAVTVSGSENGGCTKYSISLNATLSAGGTSTAGWGGTAGGIGTGAQFSP